MTKSRRGHLTASDISLDSSLFLCEPNHTEECPLLPVKVIMAEATFTGDPTGPAPSNDNDINGVTSRNPPAGSLRSASSRILNAYLLKSAESGADGVAAGKPRSICWPRNYCLGLVLHTPKGVR